MGVPGIERYTKQRPETRQHLSALQLLVCSTLGVHYMQFLNLSLTFWNAPSSIVFCRYDTERIFASLEIFSGEGSAY